MALAYFCCYHDYRKKLAKLSDQEVGRLFRALLEYSETGEAQELTGRESIAYDFIAVDIDRAKDSYEKRSVQNSENGQKGGRPKKTNGFLKSEKSQEKEKEEKKEEEQEKEEYISPPTPSPGDERDSFACFWRAYPRRMGKANARKAWDKLNVDSAMLDTILSAVERDKLTDQWQRDGGQFIPYPATWLNQRRWEDEPEESPSKSYHTYELDEISDFDLPEGFF